MDPSAGHYRQIELQSPEDFSYLINNVRRAAADSINAAFPPVEGGHDGEDDLRVRIEQLVNKYITRTFTLVAPNISINGLPIDDPTPFLAASSTQQKQQQQQQQQQEQEQEQYEPFDARKRARVEELAREEEDLLRDIAALKRRAPAAAAAAWAASQRAGLAADEAALEAARARVVDGLHGNGDGDSGNAVPPLPRKQQQVLLGGDAARPLERQEAVEQAYAGAVDTLGRLKRDMPATVARMERARLAGEYVVTER